MTPIERLRHAAKTATYPRPGGYASVRRYDLQQLIGSYDSRDSKLAHLEQKLGALLDDIEAWTLEVQERLGTKRSTPWATLDSVVALHTQLLEERRNRKREYEKAMARDRNQQVQKEEDHA